MLNYEIIINPKLLKQLEEDPWADTKVPAVLKVNDKHYSVKLAYRGNVIRKQKKKSYRVLFQKPSTMSGAHEIHLNAEYRDPSLSRNKLSLDFFSRIGVISPQSKHVLLYINGVCHGLYLELESFDQYLLTKRRLPDGPIIYATNYHANFSLLTPENKLKTRLDEGYTIKYGNKSDIAHLEQFIAMVNSAKNEEFIEQVKTYLDIEQYFKWLAGVVCTQNFDGFIHNYALYKNMQTELYEITPWDYDGTWGRDLYGKSLKYDFIPITGFNTLTARLLHFRELRKTYRDIISAILDIDFTIEALNQPVHQQLQSLIPYLHLDPFIQTDQETIDKEEIIILKFIEKRNAYLREHLNELE